MSIRLMTAAWQFGGLNPGAKLVLLALCDNASDEGLCFPSVATLANKCSMAERTVQGHIAAFEQSGLLTRTERPGRSTIYTLHPRKFCTPANSAPPQNLHPTPAESAPITIIEPSEEPSSEPPVARQRAAARVKAQDLKADGVEEAHAEAWLAIRQAKRLPLTSGAWDLVKAAGDECGLTAAQTVRECVARGWASFRSEWWAKDSAPRQAGQRGPVGRNILSEEERRKDRQRAAQILGFDPHGGDILDGEVLQ